MKKAAIGLLALAGVCCASDIENTKPARAPEIIEIADGECKDVCGGKICYQVLERYPDSPKRYAIDHEGFGDYTHIGRRMIIADGCILYKIGASNEALTLEKLR